MLEAIRSGGTNRILLDMTEAAISGGSVGAYLTGIDPRGEGLPTQDLRFAAVYESLLPETEFMETVITGGGFDFQAFDDMDQAMGWLEA
jgi:hypothetical protein